jgi:hypothetical protein
LPEVRTVLDEHLDLRLEPTLTIRSVYGRHFPWLHYLDPAWAAGTVARIFPIASAWHTGPGQNPIGYVKTATEREGLRMGLAMVCVVLRFL